MAEQYFNRDDRAAFKPMLQQYLREKAQRRGKITSDQALEGASEQFAKDRGYQELGGLVGALSTGASMAGTLGGKRSEASIIPTFMASQKDAAQTHYGNELALRDLEEKSLRTDMGIAQTIGGIDADDSKRKLDARRVDVDELNSTNSREIARRRLDLDLQDQLDKRTQNRDELGETTRHNKAMEGLYGRGRGPGTERQQAWQIVPGQAESGELYERNPYTGETRPVRLPKGFKPKDEIAAERKRDGADASAAGKLAGKFDEDYAKKMSIVSTQDQELATLKQLMDSGQKDLAVKHAEGMLKGLNASFGADAVGVEESKRLGGLLQPFRGPGESGPWFGRRVDMFYEQAKKKTDALRRSAQDARARGQATRDGRLDEFDKAPAPPSSNQSFPVKLWNPHTNKRTTADNEAELREAQAEGFQAVR